MKYTKFLSVVIIISWIIFLLTLAFEERLSEDALTYINGITAGVLLASNIWAVVILWKLGNKAQ